jgi:hypothetical protein
MKAPSFHFKSVRVLLSKNVDNENVVEIVGRLVAKVGIIMEGGSNPN